MEGQKTFIIAEAGVNHNGSLDLAIQLIDAAADAGVDAVKFQTFKAEKLTSSIAPKAEYQVQNTDASESQLDMLKKLELSKKDHFTLIEHCKKKNIQFLSTPFDQDSADFLLNTLDLPIIKISSGEVTTAPLLLQISRSKRPVVVSTGMATLDDIKTALGVLAFGYMQSSKDPAVLAFQEAYDSSKGQALLKKNVTILHCTSSYPAPFESINLRAMDTLATEFGLPVGYSDHSKGISVPIAAVARGAVIIEKHFTLNRELPGPDHMASLEPQELSDMVTAIREVEVSLGSKEKTPSADELKTRVVARKSLIAKTNIREGELLSPDNLDIKRPGNGISPLFYWQYLGKKATKTYEVGELIEE